MNFVKGENKEVPIYVTSTKGDAFTISDASYELTKITTGEVEASGSATIDGHEVSALVEPLEEGTYELVYTYQIAAERMKFRVGLEVS